MGGQQQGVGAGGQRHAQHASGSARILVALVHRRLAERSHTAVRRRAEEVGNDPQISGQLLAGSWDVALTLGVIDGRRGGGGGEGP